MKKITAFLMAILMVMLCAAPVYAAEGESEETEKVLLIIKERIGSTEKYDDFVATSNTDGSAKRFNFRWSSDNGQLTVTANSDGVITNYNFYESKESSDRKPTINKMSSSDAANKAKELVRTLNPDIADSIRIYSDMIAESLFDDGFSFGLQRTYGGIDVVGDNGYLRVNSDASKIESFSLNYSENLAFEDASEIISREEAIEKYKNQLGMVLYYSIKNNKGVLEYKQKDSDRYISAISGNAINPVEPTYNLFREEVFMDAATGNSSANKFTEAEIKNLEEIGEILSKKEAEAIVRENELFAPIKEAQLSYLGTYYDSGSKKYYYSMEFSGENFTASVSIGAKDGEVTRYNFYGNDVKEETAENISLAKKYVSLLAPKYYNESETLEYRLEDSAKGAYTFVRYVNDIPCFDNTIQITINAEKQIVRYYIRHTEAEFDTPEGILSAEQACGSMMKNCGYKLYYYPACSKDGMKKADVAHLVYDTENKNTVLNAKTGGFANEYKEKTIGNYTDIKGHYAEEIIKTLGRFGIGFEENEFKPDSVITQSEYIVLITSALLGNEAVVLAKESPRYESYYNMAIRNEIIKEGEKDDDAPVSREMAAVYMIRALGLDDVASLDGIYISKFNDVTKHIGYISILNAMGVVNGYDGNFNPEAQITRADAMIMLYNYLSK